MLFPFAAAHPCGFRRSRPGIPIEGGHHSNRRRAVLAHRHVHGVTALVRRQDRIVGCDLSHAVSFQREPVRVVHEAVEDGIGDGGIADHLVPISTGSWLVAMVEPRPWRSSMISRRSRACSGVRGGKAPVVEDQQIGACQVLEEPRPN